MLVEICAKSVYHKATYIGLYYSQEVKTFHKLVKRPLLSVRFFFLGANYKSLENIIYVLINTLFTIALRFNCSVKIHRIIRNRISHNLVKVYARYFY